MSQVSPLPFYTRARQAIADPNLQTAPRPRDAAHGRSHAGRPSRAVPDGEAARDHARRIRAHTIAHLDRYLDQFVEQATRRRRARALGRRRRRPPRASWWTSRAGTTCSAS